MNDRGVRRPRQADVWGDLLVQAQEGDRRALEQALGEMLPWLFCRARSILRNRDDAWDMAQETGLRICQALASFDPSKGGARAWAGQVLRNQISNFLRARARRRMESLEDQALCGHEDGPSVMAERHEGRARVRQALAELSAVQRMALVLRYESELSYEELGQTLRVPWSTAATRVHRGLESLRRRLGAEGERWAG
jgi:RNA polymerase sigma-70 factor (ECF subfamily)